MAATVVVVAFVCAGAAFVRALNSLHYDDVATPPDVVPSRALVTEHEVAWKDWTSKRDAVALRDVTFRVVGDQHFRESVGADWRENLAARIRRASSVFEREFRVRLVVTSVCEWKSDDGASTIHALHRALARSMVDDSADVVIGFTAQTAPYDRGVSYYYGRCCVVRTGTPQAPWPYEDETVLHEIGHLFGAWHATDHTVMRHDKGGAPTVEFDAFARTAVLATRDVDFRRGLDSVPDATLVRLHAAWKSCHPGEAAFPPFDAACTEAWCARDQGLFELACRRCERALAIDALLGPFPRQSDDADVLRWAERERARRGR